jgi:hypothetical protein
MKKLFAAIFAALLAFTFTHAFATSALKAPAGTVVADDDEKDQQKKDDQKAQDDEEKKGDEQKKSD